MILRKLTSFLLVFLGLISGKPRAMKKNQVILNRPCVRSKNLLVCLQGNRLVLCMDGYQSWDSIDTSRRKCFISIDTSILIFYKADRARQTSGSALAGLAGSATRPVKNKVWSLFAQLFPRIEVFFNRNPLMFKLLHILLLKTL